MPEMFQVTYLCQTCGASYQDKWIKQEDLKVAGCKFCTVAEAKPGRKVRYSAGHRVPSDTEYVNKLLTVDEVYKVTRVRRYQHATFIWLEGFGNQSFNLWMFSPITYRKEPSK